MPNGDMRRNNYVVLQGLPVSLRIADSTEYEVSQQMLAWCGKGSPLLVRDNEKRRGHVIKIDQVPYVFVTGEVPKGEIIDVDLDALRR